MAQHSVVYFYRVVQQSVLLFELSVHQVEQLLLRVTRDRLLEQVSSSFQLAAFVPTHEFIRVVNQQILTRFLVENAQSLLEHLVGLLEVLLTL